VRNRALVAVPLASLVLGWYLLDVGVGLLLLGLDLTVLAMYRYGEAIGDRHLVEVNLVPWAMRAAGVAATGGGLARLTYLIPDLRNRGLLVALCGLAAVVVDQVLSTRIGTSPGQRRTGRWLALIGAGWVLVHHRCYGRFRGLGLRLFGDAYVAACAGPPEQWQELGWDTAAMRQILRVDRPDSVFWPADEARCWSLAGLARVAAVAPARWLTGTPMVDLEVLTTGDGPERAIEYLASPHAALFDRPDGGSRVVGLIRTGLPYPVFAELVGILGDEWPSEHGYSEGPRCIAAHFQDAVPEGRFAWEELPGWVRHDQPGALELLRAGRWSPADGPPAGRRWIEWHGVHVAMGPEAPQPALWYAAGFDPEEAMRLRESREAPDAETLTLMAALRREAGSRRGAVAP
jgi:hypothetical protein